MGVATKLLLLVEAPFFFLRGLGLLLLLRVLLVLRYCAHYDGVLFYAYLPFLVFLLVFGFFKCYY